MYKSKAAMGRATRWAVAVCLVLGAGIAGCQDDPLSPNPTAPAPVGSDSLTASSGCIFDLRTNRWRCSGPYIPVEPPPARAWVFATHAWSASHTPAARYQSNSTGGTNTVTRVGRGVYRVTLPGISGAGGIVHVTAVAGNHQCVAEDWGPSGADMIVKVKCRRPTGPVMDGQFTMLFYREQGLSFRRAAYFVGDLESVPVYPAPDFSAFQPVTSSWSSRGGPMSFRYVDGAIPDIRFDYGVLGDEWAGKGTRPRLLIMTAVGGQGHCNPQYPRFANGGLCGPSVTKFSASVMEDTNVGGQARQGGFAPLRNVGFGFDTAPLGTNCFDVSGGYNSVGASNRVCSGGGPGRLLFKFPGIRDLTESVVIASMGHGDGGSDYCNVDSWYRGTTTETWVRLQCYDPSGSPGVPFYLHGTVALFTGAGGGPY